MRILLLFVALLVPVYLLMCQRQSAPDAEPGQVIYQPQLERARGVEQQLRDDLDRRGAEIQRQLEQPPAPPR